MKSSKTRIVSLIMLMLLILMSAVAVSCTRKPIDESRLPDLNRQQDAAEDGLISEEQAMKIALDKVPGATKDNITSFRKDYDDGRWSYEGEMIYDGIEYDFEIDAHNGNILEWEMGD